MYYSHRISQDSDSGQIGDSRSLPVAPTVEGVQRRMYILHILPILTGKIRPKACEDVSYCLGWQPSKDQDEFNTSISQADFVSQG